MIEKKFNIGDNVREQTASQKSRTMRVTSYRDPIADYKFTAAVKGKEIKEDEIEVKTLYVDCEYFSYGKMKCKSFDQNKLVFVSPSTSDENK